MLKKKDGSYRAVFFLGRDSSRMMQLDILRGIAILLVLFIHVNDVQPGWPGVLKPAVVYLQHLGPTGVDLFFVLSGFLVGGLLLKELRDRGQLDIRRFLIRRGFRIWPPYFLFIALLLLRLVWREGEPARVALHRILPNLLHLQNYLGSPREHTWSLAVEEHFYLLLPLLLFFLVSSRVRSRPMLSAIPLIAVGISIVTGVARYFAYTRYRSFNPHYATHLRLDSLMFGVLLAYLYYFRPETLAFVRPHRWIILALSFVALLLFPAFIIMDTSNRYVGSIGFIVLYLAYGAILMVLVQSPLDSDRARRLTSSKLWRALAFIGYFSYPIYLWHVDAARPVGRLVHLEAMGILGEEVGWIVAFAAYILMAVAGGAFFGMLVDRPSLALRDRLFPSRLSTPP